MWRKVMSNRSEKFLKINMWISKYLIISIPFVIATILWALPLINGNEFHEPKSLLWDIAGWHFVTWFLLVVYSIVSLVFWSAFREKVLTILTFSKERDERESYISGRASKATFYSTLAILILFFFLSGLHLHIYRKPKEDAIDGKRGTITIGFSFSFVNSATKKDYEVFDQKKNEKILVLDGIPFTQESILLFLILYHITSYHIFTRRRLEDA